MKKQLVLIGSLIAFAFSCIAQEYMYLPIILKNDDGTSGSYEIKKGDKLIYQVNAGGNEYDFIVNVNSGNSKGAIDFNYEMTNSRNTKGHVLISADARKNATQYINYFGGGELNLTNAITVWLSNKNFGDMSKKKTTMQIDNNSPETFYRPEKDEANPIVKIKGADKKLDTFIINNAKDGTGDKTMWINAIAGNTLIVKMDLGFTIVLKEIK
jgi:hypothetical protein